MWVHVLLLKNTFRFSILDSDRISNLPLGQFCESSSFPNPGLSSPPALAWQGKPYITILSTAFSVSKNTKMQPSTFDLFHIWPFFISIIVIVVRRNKQLILLQNLKTFHSGSEEFSKNIVRCDYHWQLLARIQRQGFQYWTCAIVRDMTAPSQSPSPVVRKSRLQDLRPGLVGGGLA